MTKESGNACHHCGGYVYVAPSHAESGHGKYCSKYCASLGKSWAPKIRAALPATTVELAQKTGARGCVIARTLKRMTELGLAHPSGMTIADAAKGKRFPTLVFDFGPQPDPHVPMDDLKKTLSYFIEQALLAAMPGRLMQLAERTGLSTDTTYKYVTAMHAKIDPDGKRAITFIRSWRRPRKGPRVPVYERGRGKDAPDKFEPYTRREIYERQIARLKMFGNFEAYRARLQEGQRERRAAKRRTQEGDPLLNALFGAPAERRKQERRAGE